MKTSSKVKDKNPTKTKKPRTTHTSELLSRARYCRRRVFTISEDKTIIKCVSSSKFNNNWESVAKLLPWRTARQCRDRWTYYLSPSNNLSPFSIEEDLSIVQKVNEYGTKWALISKILPGRSDNSIKNRWYSKLRGKCTIDVNGIYTLDEKRLNEPSSKRRKGENSINRSFETPEFHNENITHCSTDIFMLQPQSTVNTDARPLVGFLSNQSIGGYADLGQTQPIDFQQPKNSNQSQPEENVDIWDGEIINWASDIFNFPNDSDFLLL